MSDANPSRSSGPGRAVVTGASTGIGRAFAERLARDGYDLAIVARSQERLDELAASLRSDHGVAVEVLVADLSRSDELAAIASRIQGDERLELLVNNAGFGTFGRFDTLDADVEAEQVRLNVLAVQQLSRAAVAGMVRRGRGAIVNVASLAGMMAMPYNATYGATKAFVISFSEALSAELDQTGVRVQVLCPGFTRTEFQKRAGIDESAIPSPLWASAKDVVDASIAALDRGEVVCIPGLANRALTTMNAFVPRGIGRRLAAAVTRRMG